jgi:hypothetical protein
LAACSTTIAIALRKPRSAVVFAGIQTMLTGRSQMPEGDTAVFGVFEGPNWVAKHVQAVWRVLLTLWTRGFYSSCANSAVAYDADSATDSTSLHRRDELPPACHMHPCPTRKEAALRHLCRGGRPRTCQIRTELAVTQSDSARARATLLIWLQSAWSQARPILWMREGSSISEPSVTPSAPSLRPRSDA